VVDIHQKTVAVGLANYSHEEASKIIGLKSSEIDLALGYSYGDEVIHHNNLVLF